MFRLNILANFKSFFKKRNTIAFAICFVIICSLSIGYSALSTKIGINTDVTIRAIKDIRIDNVALLNATRGASELYTPKYTTQTINVGVSLSDLTDEITYKITIKNSGNIAMEISDISSDSFSNNNIDYIVDGLAMGDVVPANSIREFNIMFKRNVITGSNELQAVISINWQEYIAPYKETLLNGSEPVLKDNMIAITHNGTNWVKADIKSSWYNYQEKKWANVIIPKPDTSIINAPVGTEINDNDVVAYLVWIPRFEYAMSGNIEPGCGGMQTFKVNFVSTLTTGGNNDYCSASYYVHPAFTYNNKQLPGIWVGKYLTSKIGDQALIKNNSIFYQSSIIDVYQNSSTIESGHVIKNTEYGALMYLSKSAYGNLQETTTANLYGAYNINDNQWVMGNYNNINNSINVTADFNQYETDNIMGSIKGDALYETYQWASTNNIFINATNPWFVRNNFNYIAQSGNESYPFRIVIN